MKRYIDADLLIENIAKIQDIRTLSTKTIGEAISATPPADVVEVKHGEWVHTDESDHWHSKDECSECCYHTFDRIDLTHFNYCPNCGAKMDGGNAE